MTHAFLILSLALQTVSSPGAQDMQAGLEAHKQGHFDVAITAFRKATEADPNLTEAFLNLGQEYMQINDYGAAIAPLRRALELRPDLDPAHLQLGYALLAQGFAAEAIPHLERVQAVEALGIAQIETGQYQEAVANLGLALTKRPNDPDLLPGLHRELGLVYAGAAQWAKAEEAFRAETRIQPGNAEASYRLGTALLQQGKVREARTELERADRLKPDMPETLYSLGKTASLDGDPVLAEKAWLHVIEIEKQSPLAAQAHFGLAALYRRQGNAGKAQSEMEEFRKLQKTAPQ